MAASASARPAKRAQSALYRLLREKLPVTGVNALVRDYLDTQSERCPGCTDRCSETTPGAAICQSCKREWTHARCLRQPGDVCAACDQACEQCGERRSDCTTDCTECGHETCQATAVPGGGCLRCAVPCEQCGELFNQDELEPCSICQRSMCAQCSREDADLVWMCMQHAAGRAQRPWMH